MISPLFRRLSASICTLLLAITLFSSSTDASEYAPQDSAPPAKSPPRTSATPTAHQPLPEQSANSLAIDPAVFDSLGLSFNLPNLCSVSQESLPGSNAPTIAVRDSAESPAWSMRIQSIKNLRRIPDAKGQMERHLTELKEAQQFEILQNDPLQIDGAQAQLCYVRHTGQTGESFVSGWLIVPRLEESYLVFAIATTPDALPRVRKLLDASFATIRLTTPNDVSSERRLRITAGDAFLKSIRPEDLKKLVGLKQVARSYLPGKGPKGKDQERAYSLIDVSESTRSVFSQTADETTGLLFTIHGRNIQDAQRNAYIDSLAHYWVAWDLSEEQWSVVVTKRQNDAWLSSAETGVLPPATAGEPLPTLTVVLSETAGRTNEPYQWPRADVYMPQAIGWVLGRLLPRDAAEPREFKWYYYTSAAGKPSLSLRTDTWQPADNQPGHWQLTTQLMSAAQPFTSVYDQQGNLVRRTYPDGSVTEPSTVEDITRRWRALGLDFGKSQ